MSGRHRRWVCRECGNGLGGHKDDCSTGRWAREGMKNMGLTGGGAKPVDPHDGVDEPLTIHPDAPCPSSIEDTCTEQALRDAQAIDQAYGD